MLSQPNSTGSQKRPEPKSKLTAGLELENLVEDLRRWAKFWTYPQGHPMLIELDDRELEEKFGRTQ